MRHIKLLPTLLLSTAFAVAVLGGCAKSTPPAVTTDAAASAQADAAAQAAALAATQAAEEAKAAELAAKERELADREAALKQQELEAALAKADAENAAAAAAAASAAAAKQAAAKPKAPAKPATTASAPKAAAPVAPIVVPAGTRLAIEVTTPLSTKTNKVGNGVDGRLASDLVIDGRRAAKAGAAVHGSVVQVISGSKKIGGTPTLGITFDSLVAVNGSSVSINAPYTQVGKSETGKDTAKIVGGAAVGAIIGNQVSHKNGSVVGGLLGAGAGTAAAKNTGGEVVVTAGEVVNVSTQSSFEVRP